MKLVLALAMLGMAALQGVTRPPSAAAAPLLLAQVDVFERGIGFPRPPVLPETFVLLLIYDFDPVIPTPGDPLAVGTSLCLACNFVHAIGTVGDFDLTSDNSPTFGEVVARLTDGVDEDLTTLVRGLGPDGVAVTGSGQTHTESNRLQSFAPLSGATIDFIRLHIDEISIQLVDDGPPQFPLGLGYVVRGRFELWAVPVPAPSGIVLIIGPLASLVWWTRRGIRR